MKKILALFMLVFWLPAFSPADTLILKNGTRIENVVTWEEGGLIKCRRFGAVVGYPVSEVLTVEPGPVNEEDLENILNEDGLQSEPPTSEGRYKVLTVYDGDSFLATDGNIDIKVRIIGIDAPETENKTRKKPGQPYGNEARRRLSEMIMNTAVHIKGYGIEKYNRQLAEVFVKNTNVGIQLVRDGYAEVYRGQVAEGLDIGPYRQAEAEARKYRRGIWSQGSRYVSPKEWRRRYKK